ncbi:MAG: AraC family ligand binding domain-containing protein [Saprospiraceae bacterium]|nr:AraC family ligand binding domain-containing protein [Saprospiraceae bacterium]
MKNIRIPTHPIHTTRLQQFGIERIDHVNHYNPGQYHWHDYYEIFLFREGGGFHQIDFEKVSIENNSVHFVRPGQVHLLNRAPDSSGFVLLFDDDFLSLAPDNNQQLIQRLLHCNHIKCQTLLLEQADFELVMRGCSHPTGDWFRILRCILIMAKAIGAYPINLLRVYILLRFS